MKQQLDRFTRDLFSNNTKPTTSKGTTTKQRKPATPAPVTKRLPVEALEQLAGIAGARCPTFHTWGALEFAAYEFLGLASEQAPPDHECPRTVCGPRSGECPPDPAETAAQLLTLLTLLGGITPETANGFDHRLQQVAQRLQRDLTDKVLNPLIFNDNTGKWVRKSKVMARAARQKGQQHSKNTEGIPL